MGDKLGWPRLMLPGTKRKVLQRVMEWHAKLPKEYALGRANANEIEELYLVVIPSSGLVSLENFAKLFAKPISEGKTDVAALTEHCKKQGLGRGWEEDIEKGLGCFAYLHLL